MQLRNETVEGEVNSNNDRPPRRFAPGRQCAGARLRYALVHLQRERLLLVARGENGTSKSG